MSLGIPKPRPKMLDQQKRRADRETFDEQESSKARVRAKGQCEVFVVSKGRCKRRDVLTHHMISGIGRRGIGKSALAEHKQRICQGCHRLIHGHVLKLLQDGPLPVYTDAYERID